MDLTCRQKVRSTVDVASDVQVVESNSSDISKADSSKSKGQKHGHFRSDSSIKNPKAHIFFLHRLFWA